MPQFKLTIHCFAILSDFFHNLTYILNTLMKGKSKMVGKKVAAKKNVTPVKERNYKVGKGKLDMSKVAKKGEVRNPKGINISPEKRALKELTETELANAIKKVFTSTEEECLALLKDKATTLGHKVILRAAVDAAHHGNYSKFNEILERVIGKVPNKVDMTSKGESINVTSADTALIKKTMSELNDKF